MFKILHKLMLVGLCLCLWSGAALVSAAADGQTVAENSPEYGCATCFLFALPEEITGLTLDKNYTYKVEYFHFLESKKPCYNILCIGENVEDNQWLVVAEDNSVIYRNHGNGYAKESEMELIYPTEKLKKLKTEEDVLQHLRYYLRHSTSENAAMADYALRLDPNSRADGPGTWSIDIALGENHPEHFVTLRHYRVTNNGVIEEMDIITAEYKRVN